MGTYEQLERLQAGEEIPLDEFTSRYDPVTRLILERGGLDYGAGHKRLV